MVDIFRRLIRVIVWPFGWLALGIIALGLWMLVPVEWIWEKTNA